MNLLEYLVGSGVVNALRRAKGTLMLGVMKALRRVKRMLMPLSRQQEAEEQLEQCMLDVGPGVLEVALASFLSDSRPVEEKEGNCALALALARVTRDSRLVEEEGEKAVLAILIEKATCPQK